MALIAYAVSAILLVVKEYRPVAQLAEQRSPKPQVGGSTPSWPATPLDKEWHMKERQYLN